MADTEDESGNGDDSDGGASGDNKYNYNDESNRCTKSYWLYWLTVSTVFRMPVVMASDWWR